MNRDFMQFMRHEHYPEVTKQHFTRTSRKFLDAEEGDDGED